MNIEKEMTNDELNQTKPKSSSLKVVRPLISLSKLKKVSSYQIQTTSATKETKDTSHGPSSQFGIAPNHCPPMLEKDGDIDMEDEEHDSSMFYRADEDSLEMISPGFPNKPT